MAYDEGLAQRVRELLEEKPEFNEKKMFGRLNWYFFKYKRSQKDEAQRHQKNSEDPLW